LATVEVIGTRFSVTRTPLGVDIAVEHGVVLVRSESIRDRVQRLSAGQHLFVSAPSTPAAAAEPVASAAPPRPESSVSRPAPVTSSVPPMDRLLEQADERRRQGDVRGAEAALRQALSAHAGDPRAALAAFTLGKLQLDAAGRPADAAQSFSLCLSLSPPEVLAEDALARLAEARGRSGDLDGARSTAQRYRLRYANGRHVKELARWLDTP
jgi:transmembrane sensor